MAVNPNNNRYVNLYELGDDVINKARYLIVLGEVLKSASRMADPEKRRIALQAALRDSNAIKEMIDKAMFTLDIGLPEDMQ